MMPFFVLTEKKLNRKKWESTAFWLLLNNNHCPKLFFQEHSHPKNSKLGTSNNNSGQLFAFLESFALAPTPGPQNTAHFWTLCRKELQTFHSLQVSVISHHFNAPWVSYCFHSPKAPGCARYQERPDKFVPGVSSPVWDQAHPSFWDKGSALHVVVAQPRDPPGSSPLFLALSFSHGCAPFPRHKAAVGYPTHLSGVHFSVKPNRSWSFLVARLIWFHGVLW